MTTAAAQAAINRIEADGALAERVKEAGSPDTALGILRAEGFEVTQQDMRDAALDRFGDKLTPDQLDQIAGGADRDLLVLGAGFGAGAVLAVIAIGAAAV